MDVNMKLKLLSEERDGPILRCLYACPCGQGTVEEEQDYTEGHRDCWASLECSICRNNYKVLVIDDWGRIVQPTDGGGRTTSVSIMAKTGIKKMCDGWIAVIDRPEYIDAFSRSKWIGYSVK